VVWTNGPNIAHKSIFDKDGGEKNNVEQKRESGSFGVGIDDGMMQLLIMRSFWQVAGILAKTIRGACFSTPTPARGIFMFCLPCDLFTIY
jgi:hypothetical protein